MNARAAPARWPYLEHRTMQHVMADEGDRLCERREQNEYNRRGKGRK